MIEEIFEGLLHFVGRIFKGVVNFVLPEILEVCFVVVFKFILKYFFCWPGYLILKPFCKNVDFKSGGVLFTGVCWWIVVGVIIMVVI